MIISTTKTIELSMEDIKDAICTNLKEHGIYASKGDIELRSEEIKEEYSIGVYDCDYIVVGHNITATIKVK